MKSKRYIVCHEETNYQDEKMRDKPPRHITIDDNAIADPKHGFICSCGRWTKTSVDPEGKLTHEIKER